MTSDRPHDEPQHCVVPSAPDPGTDPLAWLRWAQDLLVSEVCDGCTDCSPKCAGPITMWREEALAIARLTEERGVVVPAVEVRGLAPCPFLDREAKLCRVYAVRPLVCRAFGRVPWLPCARRPPGGPAGPRPPLLAPEMIRVLIEGYTSRTRRTLHQWLTTAQEDG